jgi:superfamily II DNA or RNA helicase
MLLAPIRVGFTATMPEEPERRLQIEGYTGRIISKLSVRKAAELKILAEPRIKLIPVPATKKGITPYTAYPDVYDLHITYNKVRNTIIAKEVRNNIKNGITTLVMVTQIDHGEAIQAIAYNDLGLNLPFIQGSTKSDMREKVKDALETKQFKAVITTTIFREGVNIRSLGCVIIAFGGKSAKATVQALGRALRRTSEKDEALIIDFLDPVKYLSVHTIERLGIYLKNGWKIVSE